MDCLNAIKIAMAGAGTIAKLAAKDRFYEVLLPGSKNQEIARMTINAGRFSRTVLA